jgi:type I restriction enzyme R subunit
LQSFIRLYGFVSQMITFQDADLEKLYVFAKHLNRKLPRRRDRLPYQIRDAVSLDSFRIQQTYSGSLSLQKTDTEIAGISTGTPHLTEDERDTLTNILMVLNEAFATDFTDEDKVDMERIEIKLDENEDLRAVISSDNTRENIRYKFDQIVDEMLLEFVHTKLDLYKKLSDPKVNTFLKERWFNRYYGRFRGAQLAR